MKWMWQRRLNEPRDRDVLQTLRAKGPLTLNELPPLSGWSRSAVYNALRSLRARGWVEASEPLGTTKRHKEVRWAAVPLFSTRSRKAR